MEIGRKLVVIERLSLMLRKVDTSVLGVINFMWSQRHCFNALHVMTVVTSVLGDAIVLYSVWLAVNNDRGH